MLSVIDLKERRFSHSTKLEEFEGDLETVDFLDFEPTGTSDIDNRPLGTLLFTSDRNTHLFTAELFDFSDGLTVQKQGHLCFKKDKTPKLMKIVEKSYTIFLVNTSAPFKLYVVKVAPISSPTKQLEIQALNKRFTYLYEVGLSFDPMLNGPKYFDCYLHEKKDTYM